MMSDVDMTLETLLSVRTELAPGVDEQLLRQCYQIQKRFQFSADRSVSTAGMEKAIDEFLKTLPSEAGKQA